VYNEFMPKLSKVAEAQRIAAVIQVIAAMQVGTDMTDALARARITRDQFNLWITKSPEAVDLFYGLIQESEKRELTAILSKRETILNNLLTKVSASTASNLDILATLAYLDKRQSDLENKQGVSNAAEINAQEYLRGPKTEKKASRLTATVTIEGIGKVTVSTEEREIIDGSFEQEPQHTSPLEQSSPHQALLEADLEADRTEQT
jgi:hypothetical protein